MGRGSKVDRNIRRERFTEERKPCGILHSDSTKRGNAWNQSPLPPYVRPEFDSQGRPLEVGIQGYPMSK